MEIQQCPDDEPITTNVYIVVPPSPLFAAHWSFFIPDAVATDQGPQELSIGRRIHVSGDRLNGFGLEIIRNYDFSKHRSAHGRKYAIGLMEPAVIHTGSFLSKLREKDDEDGGGYVDNTPVDDFERVCLEVHAPGPSLRTVSGNGARRPKMEVKDCQWWVSQVVDELEKRSVLLPLETSHEGETKKPTELIAALPRN
ncbi:unnamed protein product [Zymoseptoria tritici ST99CH_1A5]|uniref:Uncharacterized protein n=1 Tax=Zymoseptoria tritici ST99CH_1A5 TaxID=1276529 RepID=A0A1Y6LNT0_ZYMTR|nr:unnamed protein product [Zymoseptoria tritici ST99CH_1A5]